MARIKSKTIRWNPSPDEDVVGYNVYVLQGETAQPYDGTVVTTSSTEIKVPDDFPEETFDKEGKYVIQISAVDDMGNESDTVQTVAEFDFVPPLSPSGLEIL